MRNGRGIVYLLTNLINGKNYIGQTTHSLQFRFKQHLRSNDKNMLTCRAVKKYGKENFIMKSIKRCNTRESLDYWEKYYIKKYNTLAPRGYNLTTGGNHYQYNSAIQNKKALIDLATKRLPKPTLKTNKKLNSALNDYRSRSSSAYDKYFKQKIEKLAPQWFENTPTRWTIKKIVKLAKKYDSSGAFKKDYPSIYRRIMAHKWLPTLTNILNWKALERGKHWTLKLVIDAAKQCRNFSEFIKTFSGAYDWAKTNNKIEYLKKNISWPCSRENFAKFLKAYYNKPNYKEIK